jgi:hypothetical protein
MTKKAAAIIVIAALSMGAAVRLLHPDPGCGFEPARGGNP